VSSMKGVFAALPAGRDNEFVLSLTVLSCIKCALIHFRGNLQGQKGER
jgi:hypothetical protein